MNGAGFLEVVRKACLPAIWSQGVKLARGGAVTRIDGAEPTYRVRAPGHAIAPTVTLYPEHGEWTCDCGGKADPCAHVAAATIVATQPEQQAPRAEAKPAPVAAEPAAPSARLVYRLGTKGRLLTLARFVVRPNGSEERIYSLASGIARKGSTAFGDLVPTHEDLKLDFIVGGTRREEVPLERMRDVLGALAKAAEVTFRGEPVRVSDEPIAPRAVVDDGPRGGFVLRIEKDPAIDEVVALGVARVGSVLRPLAETDLTGFYLERLPITRAFAREEAGELVTRALPELERTVAVTIATKRLPRADRTVRPRIAFDLGYQGHALSVLPTLVYGDPPVLRIDGDRAVLLGKSAPHRKLDEERELVNRLRDELHLVPGRRVDLDGPEAARLLGRIREFQRRLGGALERAIEAPELVARIVIDGDRFDVVFETEEAGGTPRRADAAAVLHAYRDGLELTPLLDGGFGAIPKDFLARYGDRLADLLAARRPDGSVQPAAMLDLGALAAELDLPRPGTLDKLAPLVEGFDAIPSAPLPPGLRAELRSYQRRGVDWLSFLRDAGLGGVLADDMGLGKTLQALCVLRGRSLVICPKSVVYNWAAEIQRFRPDLSVAIYHGARRELDERADVTLTTYAVLRLDVERLAERRWDVVVLDEAQAIKNPESQTARAAFALSADFRLALSGTPVENRLDELWSVMHFANPGLLGGRSDFQTRFAEPLTRGDGAVAERLRARIRPFVLRRHKRDVLPELPPRTDALLYVELDEAERAVYDAVRAATKQEIVERLAAGGSVLAALEALLRLRQAACHVGLVPGQSREGSSKVERLLGALEDAVADGHKALVFSQWTSLLDRVEPHLREAGISFTRLDGSTRDRAGVVAEFQNPAGPPVLLISLKAGGTGLNLTAADHVFLLDPWWNPAVEEQAADRAHRIGQDRPVMVYRLVAKDTVEERMLELQRAKRSLAEAALGEADRAVGITREDLLRLLD